MEPQDALPSPSMDFDIMHQNFAEGSVRGLRDSQSTSPGDTRDRSDSPNRAKQRPRKKRIRNWTADDRAAHRVFEKSRREAFRERLTRLARLLPSLAETDPQRLSKHVVADECVAFVEQQHARQRRALEYLRIVLAERDELLTEVNHWRGRAGLPVRAAACNDTAVLNELENNGLEQLHLDRSESSNAEDNYTTSPLPVGARTIPITEQIIHPAPAPIPANVGPAPPPGNVCDATTTFPPSISPAAVDEPSYYLNHFGDVLDAQRQVDTVLGPMGTTMTDVDESLLLSLAGCDGFNPPIYESADFSNVLGPTPAQTAPVYLPT